MNLTTSQCEALYSLYPQVRSICGDEAFDVDGNKVQYDMNLIQAKVDATAYIAQRAAKYPPITDYIDGVVKGDQTQIDSYITACLAVKAKYPKSK